LWCWRSQRGEKVSISDITDKFVKLNLAQITAPQAANVRRYAELQSLHAAASRALRCIFARHQKFVAG